MDNHHVRICSSYISCGISELTNVASDVDAVLYALATELYHPSRGNPVAAFIWSDLKDSNGDKLFMRVSGFGTQSVIPLGDNPKTGNEIFLYCWKIDHKVFREWYKQKRIERAKNLR